MRTLNTAQRGALTERANRLSRISAVARPREEILVARILGARRFHPRAVAVLAHSRHFAVAASALEVATGAANVVAALYGQLDAIRLFRLAVAFDLCDPGTSKARPQLLVEDLRGDPSEAARLTLAAFGEPIQWGNASRRERAAYALHRLVATRRAVS